MVPAQVAMGLNFFGPSPLLPLIIGQYHLSRSATSLMIVAVTVVVTAFLIPGGVLATRLGTKKTVAISALLMSSGTLSMVAPNFWTLVALRVVFGAGGGMLLPATTAVAAEWFGPRERSFVVGINLAGQGLGVASSMLLGGLAAEALRGWQPVLTIYGAAALVAFLAWMVLARTPPRVAAEPDSISAKEVMKALTDRNALILSIAAIGPFSVFTAFATWLPTYYHESFGIPLERASAQVAILPIIGVIVNPISGVVMAKLGRRKPLLFLTGVLCPIGALASFLTSNPLIIVGGIGLLGISFWLFVPALFTIPAELPGVPLERVAMVTSVALLSGNLATVFSPWLVGAMTDALGGSYVPGLTVVALTPLLILVSAALLPETGPKAALRRDAEVKAKP